MFTSGQYLELHHKRGDILCASQTECEGEVQQMGSVLMKHIETYWSCPVLPKVNPNQQKSKSRVGDSVNSCADIKCDEGDDLCLVAPSSDRQLTHTKSPTIVENGFLSAEYP